MKSIIKHKDCHSFHAVENILLGLNVNRYSKGSNNEFWGCEATLLKLRQNKKGRIFVCLACQNSVFLLLEAEKKDVILVSITNKYLAFLILLRLYLLNAYVQ